MFQQIGAFTIGELVNGFGDMFSVANAADYNICYFYTASSGVEVENNQCTFVWSGMFGGYTHMIVKSKTARYTDRKFELPLSISKSEL